MTPYVRQLVGALIQGLDEYITDLDISMTEDDDTDFVFWINEESPITLWLKQEDNDMWKLSVYNCRTRQVSVATTYSGVYDMLFSEKNLVYHIRDILM